MDHREQNDARSDEDDLLSQQPELDLAAMDFSDDLPTLEGVSGVVDATPVDDVLEAEVIEAEVSEPQKQHPVVTPEISSTIDDLPEDVERSSRRKLLFTLAPSWLISLLAHVILILILAAIALDPVNTVISVLQASNSVEAEPLEEFDIQGPTVDLNQDAMEPISTPTAAVPEVVEMPEVEAPMMPVIDSNLDALDTNSLTESIMPSSLLRASSMTQMTSALNSRSAASKSEMLEKFGGTAASEKAVAMALKWIADHQLRSGGWSFRHTVACRGQCDHAGEMAEATNAATALALLPFLGAGQTHLQGQYKETVSAGLRFLIDSIDVKSGRIPTGSWWEDGGRMYSHGLAAITVCEAYAMTGDPDLYQPAQLSLNYLIDAQDPRNGGWRYYPQKGGDTSVVGWCLMALKSGKMGKLAIPDATFQGADRYLSFVSTNNGAYYGYDKPTAELDGRQATIAVGLLCRMYLGWPKDHPGLQEGIAYLNRRGPKLNDLYYSYYATQVMRHHGGEPWEKWNDALRDNLIKEQEKTGHAAGSWTIGGRHADKGGRLYSTSLATMMLEVYYRHMPLYSEKSSEDDFEI